MSFIFKKKPGKENKTQKLERQQYLAKFEPTNVVNYSDCDLEEIPPGTSALCNLWLKEALIIHSNRLKNLKEEGSYDGFKKLATLRVLDAYNNRLSKIPAEIRFLVNLQVLNLENNNLSALCSEICSLKFLQTLILKKNKIKELPQNMGDLKSLRTFDISNNLVAKLPLSMCQNRSLEALLLDADNMIYPPAEICADGVVAVLKFLCKEAKIDYVPSSEGVLGLMKNPRDSSVVTSLSATDGSLGNVSSPAQGRFSPSGFSRSCENIDSQLEVLNAYERQKEQKRLEMAKLQREILEKREQEAMMLAQTHADHQFLLSCLKKENEDIDAKLEKINERHDLERLRMLEDFKLTELSTRSLIENALLEHEEAIKRDVVLAGERLRLAEEGALNIKLSEYENLKKADVQKAMELQMRELYEFNNFQNLNEEKKRLVLQEVMALDAREAEKLDGLLKMKDFEMNLLLQEIASDEKMQKKAVLLLMRAKDDRFSRINEQLRMIQKELTKITAAEMKNRDLRDEAIQAQLIQQRDDLIKLLSVLMEEKEQRSEDLRRRMMEMEEQRLEEQADYWLVQYQRLLDAKPDSFYKLETALDEDVKQLLIEAKATIYLPIFAKRRISLTCLLHADERILESLGVHDRNLQRNLLNAVQYFKNRNNRPKKDEPPKSPEKPSTSAIQSPIISTKAHFEMDCVICLENSCSVVFVPCGHVCCCTGCGDLVDQCPLCRSAITQKVDLSQQSSSTAA